MVATRALAGTLRRGSPPAASTSAGARAVLLASPRCAWRFPRRRRGRFRLAAQASARWCNGNACEAVQLNAFADYVLGQNSSNLPRCCLNSASIVNTSVNLDQTRPDLVEFIPTPTKFGWSRHVVVQFAGRAGPLGTGGCASAASGRHRQRWCSHSGRWPPVTASALRAGLERWALLLRGPRRLCPPWRGSACRGACCSAYHSACLRRSVQRRNGGRLPRRCRDLLQTGGYANALRRAPAWAAAWLREQAVAI